MMPSLAPSFRHHPMRRLYYWLDLYAYGKPDVPDHNKVMSTVVIFTFIIGHFTGHPFSVQTTLVLGCLGLGPRTVAQLLKGKAELNEQQARLSGATPTVKEGD